MNEGTTVAATQRCYDLLQPIETAIRSQLLSSGVNHFDETGLRCAGKLHWLHNCSQTLRKLSRHPKINWNHETKICQRTRHPAHPLLRQPNLRKR
ncbi:MAG: transposase [Saprospirales bacterium]|nr:transposase [Saprospirales bacterium]